MPKITTVKLSDLIPDELNGNRGTIRGQKALEQSMEKFGFAEAGLLDKNGRIVSGNKRHEAAGAVGLDDEVIVIETDGRKPVYIKRGDVDLDTPEGRQLAWALNRVHELSFEVDPLAFTADLESGLDMSWLYDEDEIAPILEAAGTELLNGTEGDTEAQIDKADELQEKWQVKTGDLWQLGDHRLICGDCTDAATVARVMGGEKADMIFTSPPYNRGTTTGGGFNSGGLSQQMTNGYSGYSDNLPVEDYRKWQAKLLLDWWNLLSEDGAIFYNHRPRVQSGEYETPMDWQPGLPVRQIVIWNSGAGINFSPTHYRISCEWVVIFAKSNFRLISKGSSGIGDVWQIGVRQIEGHPAPFPVELPSIALKTTNCDLIYDPFSGSGTTLIACENLNRRCRAIEIEPKYCAVTLERWATHTGKTPELIEKST